MVFLIEQRAKNKELRLFTLVNGHFALSPFGGGQGGGYCLIVSKSNFNYFDFQTLGPSTVVFVRRAACPDFSSGESFRLTRGGY